MLFQRFWFLTIYTLQTVMFLAATVLSNTAIGQVSSRGRPMAPFRNPAPILTPKGIVTALTAQSITLKGAGHPAEAETVFPLDQAVAVSRLKAITLSDVSEPIWATIYRGGPSPSPTNEITVAWIKLSSQAPAESGGHNEANGKPMPPMTMRFSITGSLTILGSKAALQANGQTIPLRFTETTRVYRAQPVSLKEVQIGAEVMVDLKVADRKFVVRGIDILPSGDVSSTAAARAEAENAPWTALGLEQTNFDSSSLYFEKSLAAKVKAVKTIYQQFSEEARACRKQAETLLTRADDLVSEANRLIGGTPPKEMQASWKNFVGNLAKTSVPLSKKGTRFALCLVTRSTIKDFLRKGGSLPDFSYDRAHDTVEYVAALKSLQATNAAELFTLVIPVTGLETVETDARETFNGLLHYSQLAAGAALHELIEGTLIARLKPSVHHHRWFNEGMATALAIRLARQYVGETASQAFATNHCTEPYQELADTLSLRYWLPVDISVETPVPAEAQLSNARYAYATLEAERLLVKGGPESIARILDRAAPLNANHDLEAAIKEVMGEDIAERLNRYQRFRSSEVGLIIHAQAFAAASSRKDHIEALRHVLRGMELHDGDDLIDYAQAALCLARAGYDSFGDRVFQREMQYLEGRGLMAPLHQCKKLFTAYALLCDRTNIANQVAEEVLKQEPNYAEALAVRMLRLVAEGKPAEAKEIAQRVEGLGISPKSPAYQAATKLLKAN